MIKQIRAENKTYGKAKICVILRSYFGINVSKRTPGFSGSRSALRYKKNAYLASMPNCLSLGNTPQMTMEKEIFCGDWMLREQVYANVYSKANSANAAKFLKELVENAPYKVRSIQVDGGFWIRERFRKCLQGIVFVLSPAKPTYNGKIERSNRVFREEFYADLSENTIVGVLRELMNFLRKYNSYRPQGLLAILRIWCMIVKTIEWKNDERM